MTGRPYAALAPMAGVTDACFRLLCRELGADWSVTEMVSAKGLLSMPETARAGAELLRRAPQEGPVGAQLFGRDPALMADAARRLADRGFAFVDVNMGCPAPKIVRGGEGSALMREPLLAGRIVERMALAVDLPVTVKLRAGWDEAHRNAVEIARIAQESGAAALTVHGRTRAQFYAGRADWGIIAQVARQVSIPVIGNGDVASGADALKMLRETGCAGVAVGRGAQGNPFVFEEIAAALCGQAPPPPVSFERRVRMAIRHLEMMRALYGDRGAANKMRGHAAWYLSGARGCAQLRGRINALSRVGEMRALLTELL